MVNTGSPLRFVDELSVVGIFKDDAGILQVELANGTFVPFSVFVLTLMDDADATAFRATLGVQPTNNPTFTGGSVLGNAIVSGSFRLSRTASTASFALATNSLAIQSCNATSGAITVTNVATTTTGYTFMVIKTDTSANAVTVTGTFNGNTGGIILQNRGDFVVFNTTGTSGQFEIIATNRLAPSPRTLTVATVTTATLDPAQTDIGIITAQAGPITLAAPGPGQASEGQRLQVRIKDNASPRPITHNAIFRAMGVALPTTTVASKWLYMEYQFNRTDTRWDLIRVNQEA